MEVKLKIEWAKKYHRPTRAMGPIKQEFSMKVLGLESHTFDIGNAKYAAKYKKTGNAIANHIQREYEGGADIAKAIKELSLLSLQVPGSSLKQGPGRTSSTLGTHTSGSRTPSQ